MKAKATRLNKVSAAGVAALFTMAMGPMFTVIPASAAPGDITDNSGLIPFEQGFFAFEVESPLGTLKEVPIWHEIEQMLDNPYAIVLEPNVAGNDQGWQSYRSTDPRRRSFIFRDGSGNPCAPLSPGCSEVPLAGHLVHPLNYDHSTGEELRLLNILFEEAPWEVPYQLVLVEASNTDATKGPLGAPRYEYTYRPITVSAGETRMEDDEATPDFNSPMAPDDRTVCVVAVDQFFSPGPSPAGSTPTGEGAIICGGDPGEPGYAGFGFLRGPARIGEQYSTPAFPMNSFPAAQRVPGTDITAGLGTGSRRLFDPARGFINPRIGAAGGLRKPSLRIIPYGAPANPGFLANSEAALIAREVAAAAEEGEASDPSNAPAFLAPSNENDYYRGATRAQKETARNVAVALGKALFWDMQVGSDGVQACGTCHFHAGADDRTKNQTNPNHLGGDLTLQIHGGVQNTDMVASDFPLHRCAQDSTDPSCHVNDVVSSMGVIFGTFADIPTPGGGRSNVAAFIQIPGSAATTPRPVTPDIRGSDIDPIPLFQGLRRVEPRNTPTLFATAMNFDNFWDGRARHDFNGGSVFGPSDPQSHVMVDDGAGNIVPTRQIIRFASIASLSTGPALSDFEMSFAGRNWAKLGKKLLQQGVVPLANQLVDPNDSVLGPYSNQPGNPTPDCAAGPLASRAVGKPGLCRDYEYLIRNAFYPALWRNATQHLNGCYSNSDPLDTRTPKCADVGVAVAIPVLAGDAVVDSTNDPFDGYVLTPAASAALAANTSQFTQMEANMSLFFGLSTHAWVTMLVPDDSPFDRFMDTNPDSHTTFGESGEPGVAVDIRNCFGENGTGGVQPCFTEVGNFKRDPGVIARMGVTVEGAGCDPATGCQLIPSGGTRTPGSVDPLLGVDFFLGSNLSLKNPKFRSLRCGECHAGGTLTDHTFEISHQVTFGDRIQEFVTGQPGLEKFPEALGRGRVIAPFLLEGELQENAQDGIERNNADFCTVAPCRDANGNPIPGTPADGFPQGQALFDNGVYNIGVTPIDNDVSRGGPDAFGWPLSLGYLALKNLGGVDYSPGGDDPSNGFAQPLTPGIPLPNFDPAIDPTGGGLFEPTAHDQQINPGFGEEPVDPLLPPHLAPWASNINVGDESNIDEVFIGLNTLQREPHLEGFVDAWGPFNPAAILGESFNNARQPEMATWPNVNRVNAQGSFKAPPLRQVALTGPYFHNGGKLTLRQQLDFYTQGGDFPITNAAHRDFLIVNLLIEDEALGGVDVVTGLPEFTEAQKEEIIVSVVDFLLELTDERVAFERAPFDHPEMFVPLDGTAPENTFGRPGFLANLANGMFRQVPASGMGGIAAPLQNFLGVTNGPRLVGAAADCGPAANNHYCH